MKVLFLDVDGVLNTDKEVGRYGIGYVNPHLVSLLKYIVVSTNAYIVLSSSWRLIDNAKKVIEKILYIKKIHMIDSTPSINGESRWTPRSEEIIHWLSFRPQIKNYAVVDDSPDAGYNLEENFFQTDPEVGLTIELADDIIEHLNR